MLTWVLVWAVVLVVAPVGNALGQATVSGTSAGGSVGAQRGSEGGPEAPGSTLARPTELSTLVGPWDARTSPRILIVASFERFAGSTREQEDGLRRVLDAAYPRASIRSDYLVSVFNPEELTPAVLDALADTLRAKFGRGRFDLVVTIDSLAFRLMTGAARDVVGQAPLIFSGLVSSEADARRALQDAGISGTGVLEQPDMIGALRLIGQLMPDRASVLVVSRGTVFSNQMAERGRREIAQAAPGLIPKVVWSKAGSRAELENEILSLSDDSAVLYVAFADAMDKGDELLRLQGQPGRWSVPAFGMYETQLSPWIIGGRMVSARRQGEAAGAMATTLLNGTPISAIPIDSTSSHAIVFREAGLRAWGIPESRLPEGSVVVERGPTWKERLASVLVDYVWMVYAGATLLVLLLVAVVLLLLARRRQRQIEAKLRETQERYELAIRSSTEGVWDWDIERDHVHWSGALRERLGFGPEKPSEDGPTNEWQQRLHPDDVQRVEHALSRHLATDEPYVVEYRLRYPSGEYRWMQSRGKAFRNDQGKAVRMLGSLVDVHDRVLAEQQRRTSDELFRQLFERNNDATLILGDTGTIMEANPAAIELLGVDQHRLNELKMANWPATALRPSPQAAFEGYLQGQARGEFGIARDGRLVELEYSAARVGAGQHLMVLRDVTEQRRIEQELRRGQQRYRLAVDAGRVAVWSADLRTSEIDSDPLLIELLMGEGSGIEELGVDSIARIVHPNDLPLVKATWALCVRGEVASQEIEIRVCRKDGSVRWLLAGTAGERGTDGQVVRLNGTAQDITERRSALDRLREAQIQLENITNNVPGMVYRTLQRTDGSHFIQYVSSGSVALLGQEPEELIGTVHRLQDRVLAEDRCKLFDPSDPAIPRKGDRTVEYRIQIRPGEWRWMRDVGRYSVNADGTVLWDGVIVDQTHEHSIAEALKESERRYREIVQTAQEGIWLVDPDWKTRFVNLRMGQMLNHDPSDMVGRHIFEFMDDAGREDAKAKMASREVGQSEEHEFRFLRRDGSSVWCWVTTNAIVDDSGKFAGALAMLTDMTERRRADQLRRHQTNILRAIAVGEPLAAVLERVCLMVEEQSPGTLASVLLLQPDQSVRTGAAPSLPEEYSKAIDGMVIGPSVGSCGTAMFRRERVVVSNIATDPLWTAYREHALVHGLRACWSQPVIGVSGSVLGSMAMYRRDVGEPTALDLQLVQSAVDVVGIAVQRAMNEQTIRTSEQRLSHIVRSMPLGLIALGRDFVVREWNLGAERMFGYSASEMLGASAKCIIPPASWPYVGEIWSKLLVNAGGFRGSNKNVTKDGRLIECEWYNSPLVDDQGQVVGVVSICEDVTELRKVQRRQDLLRKELDHRVKNNLASVMTLAQETGRNSSDYSEFLEKFSGRLGAMSRMHEALASSRWTGADLWSLASQTFEALGSSGPGRATIEGERVKLSPRSSQTLAMALYELGTNAAKYGALSGPAGRVSLSWKIQNSQQMPSELHVRWVESGGPPVIPPKRRGFGTEMIETAIAHELRGVVTLSFAPAGVVCDIRMPLASATALGESAQSGNPKGPAADPAADVDVR